MQSTRKAEIGQKKILFYVHQDTQDLKNKAERIKTKDGKQTSRVAPPIPECGRLKKQGAAKTPSKNGSDAGVYCVCGGTCRRAGKVSLVSSAVQRWRCVKCNRCREINQDPNHEAMLCRNRGLILEQICKGMSLSSAGNTPKNIRSKTYTASGVLAIIHNEQPGLRLVTDDIESSLKYGKKWSIDESIIRQRKKNTAGSEKDAHKIYLLGVIDTETKVLVKISAYDRRPKKGTIADFLVDAAKKAGKPRVIISDCYAAYAPAIRTAFGGGMIHEKRNLRREGLHNNEIERFWKTIKSELLVSSSRRFSSAQDIRKYIELYATYYNHIRTHSTIGATPAACAGYDGKTIATFADLLEMSRKPDILFVTKLRGLSGKVNVDVGPRRVIVSPRTCDEKTWSGITRILSSCGFRSIPFGRWMLNTYGFGVRKERIEQNTGRKAAQKPFTACARCEKFFFPRSDVEKQVGYIETKDGNLVPQSRCRKCRSAEQKRRQRPDNGAVSLDVFFTHQVQASSN